MFLIQYGDTDEIKSASRLIQDGLIQDSNYYKYNDGEIFPFIPPSPFSLPKVEIVVLMLDWKIP